MVVETLGMGVWGIELYMGMGMMASNQRHHCGHDVCEVPWHIDRLTW